MWLAARYCLSGSRSPKWLLARHGANPILAIEPFRLKVRRQEPVINVKNKIELPVFHQFRDASLPGKEFKLHLITVRSHTAGTSAEARLYKHYQGLKCGNGFSPA